MIQTGVYQIRHLASGKRYIGSAATDFVKRWRQHSWCLASGRHHSAKLQAAWNKHGANAFVFEILLYCDSEDCLIFEQMAIDCYEPEYNICLVAGNSLGRRHSQWTKHLISQANLGNENSRGSKHPRARLDEQQVVLIKRLLADGHLPRTIAQEFGVSRGSISAIKGGRSWSFIKI